MLEDEISNRLRNVEALGVVIASRCANDHDLATEPSAKQTIQRAPFQACSVTGNIEIRNLVHP
jgi:hypothetical protein